MLNSFFKLSFFLITSITIAQTKVGSQDDTFVKKNNNFLSWGLDSDGDGIKDKKDACPDIPGLKNFNGCPDTDGDGIIDSDDLCPEIAGLGYLKGCPDSDMDGFTDHEDLCPFLAGLEEYNGCPDTDKDGVMDSKDECPRTPGLIENKGCPKRDLDNDGIEDKDDLCPNIAGVKEYKGCPGISEKELYEVNKLAQAVDFESGNTLYNKSNSKQLDGIVNILINYPNTKWNINGYTDSVGSEETNLKLSNKRANSVKKYLISKGLFLENFTAVGYGEKKPIDTNVNAKGRKNNRRIEIKLLTEPSDLESW